MNCMGNKLKHNLYPNNPSKKTNATVHHGPSAGAGRPCWIGKGRSQS